MKGNGKITFESDEKVRANGEVTVTYSSRIIIIMLILQIIIIIALAVVGIEGCELNRRVREVENKCRTELH